jgi:hypothetical protein
MKAGLADPYQRPSNLRLKRDDCNNRNRYQETLVKISNPRQFKPFDDRVKYQTTDKKNEDDPPEKSFSSRTLKETEQNVNENTDEQELKTNCPELTQIDPIHILENRIQESNSFIESNAPEQLHHPSLQKRQMRQGYPVKLPRMFFAKPCGLIQMKYRIHIVLQLQSISLYGIHMLSVYFGGGLSRTAQTAPQAHKEQPQNAKITNTPKTF